MKHLQVREVLYRELLKEQELSVAPHVLSLARASNRAPRISSPESSSIHLDSHMPLLSRARRVSQCHRCRYVFSRCLRAPEDTKGKEVSNASSSQTRCERTESRRVLTFCTGTTYFLRNRQIEEPDTPSRRAAALWVRWLTLSTISLECGPTRFVLGQFCPGLKPSSTRLLCRVLLDTFRFSHASFNESP